MQLFTKNLPSLPLFLSIIMQQVVPSDLGTAQKVVLAAVDDVERYSQRLHHGCTGSAHVVWRPYVTIL